MNHKQGLRKKDKIIFCTVGAGLSVEWYAFFRFDFDFKILTALKGWVGHAPQGRGALHIIII